ncbi:hypothetical protein SESBI_09809 [Sesbania bispinosa]|nr:hypothetical protein SESBI_09809 [Sesbania bispinosa]
MARNRTPVKFQRVAAAFDADVARARLFDCSESEHLPAESSADLLDLVQSFMEREGEVEDRQGEVIENFECSDSEKREMLQEIFGVDDCEAKEKIRKEVSELAWGIVGDKSSSEFKRHLMSCLRDRGFDAGLCKSRWEKNTRFPAGEYEYIDVNFAGNRYIIEISLVTEFEIARPTNQYSSLLDVFPSVFVGKVEELKRVVRLMCTAMKGSMKSMDLHIPPWRRNGYMQAKWFSSYKRITNEVTRKVTSPLSLGPFSTRRPIPFEARPVRSYKCRDVYGSKTAFRVGQLTTAFDADGLGMQS